MENTLKMITVYVVDGWATELRKGKGVLLKNLNGELDKYLVFCDDSDYPETIYERKVFTKKNDAVAQLEKEKKEYIAFMEKEIKRHTENLSKIK